MSNIVGNQITVCIAIAMVVLTTGAVAQGKIEYRSVAQAREILMSKSEGRVEHKDGWLVINIQGAVPVSWSFPPKSHEAHPAVGKRTLVEKDGRFHVVTELLCEAQKAACDRLHATYNALDAQMMKALEKTK